MSDYINLLSSQKEFYSTGKTRDISFRKKQLYKLLTYLIKNEKKIEEALWKDLHKGYFESYATETGICRSEIRNLLKIVGKLSKPRRVGTPLVHFMARSYIISEPYGQNLIIAPWNFPFQLVIQPLAGAIAAGNTAIVKPSEITTNTEVLIEEMIKELFPPEYIACVKGGVGETTELLKLKFDHIFFTGSPKVGKIVMEAASKNLVHISLELGGKNPVIVDETANIDLAARRITWGKLINGGQTCVAPDYLFVHNSVKAELTGRIIYYIEKFYGKNVKENQDFPRMVNKTNFQRISGLLKDGKILFGGETDEKSNYIGPTIIDEPSLESNIMQEEIFGPVLPLISFSDINEVVIEVLKKEKPLSMYVFSTSVKNQKKLISSIPAGNGAINDVVIQFANSNLPFGGVGSSGMGAYHGKSSFYAFSHQKSILKKSNLIDIPIRYAPYSKSKLGVLKWFIK